MCMYNGLTVHFYVLHAISNILYLISRLCLYIYIYINVYIYIYVCGNFIKYLCLPAVGFDQSMMGFRDF